MKKTIAFALSATLFALVPVEAHAGPPALPQLHSTEGAKTTIVFQPTRAFVRGEKAPPWAPRKSQPAASPFAYTFQAFSVDTQALTLDFDIDPTTANPAATPDIMGTYVKPLEAMTSRDATLGRPPICQFSWGANGPSITGIVTQYEYTLSKFRDDGSPNRIEIHLILRKANFVDIQNHPL
jgi:hypothetical protein